MAEVLGLDIGGSKTHAVLADGAGRPVLEARCASASLQSVGAQAAAAALDDLVDRLGAAASAVDVVVAGSAGLDTPAVAERLVALVQDRFPGADVTAIHDARLLLAAAREDSGCVFILGTGSCAWALGPDGRTARTGGWGWVLGDESSGFGMVRAAVRAALADWQAGRTPSLLTQRLCAAVGVPEPGDLIDAFYTQANSGVWARYLGAVVAALDAGSPEAATVVDGAMAHAAAEIVQAAGQVGITGPVILGGGVAMNVPAVTDVLMARLQTAGLTDVRVLDRDPVLGAVDMALQRRR